MDQNLSNDYDQYGSSREGKFFRLLQLKHKNRYFYKETNFRLPSSLINPNGGNTGLSLQTLATCQWSTKSTAGSLGTGRSLIPGHGSNQILKRNTAQLFQTSENELVHSPTQYVWFQKGMFSKHVVVVVAFEILGDLSQG